MKRITMNWRVTVAIFCASVMVGVVTGCSTLKSKGTATPQTASTDMPASTPSTTPAVQDSSPVYHDFGDIMLPRALSVDKKESLVMTANGVTSGILVLKGSLDVNSLSNFFENKMPVDGWRKMGSFRSARSIMLFEKETRWCVIGISDGTFSTKVEIWVAPMDKQPASGFVR